MRVAASSPADERESPRFRQVEQTSHDQAFTTKFEFRLVEGLIWYRTRGAETPWKKFAGTGQAPLDVDKNPAQIVRLSVDGGILYAISRFNRIFDAKINTGEATTVEWSSRWGWPLRLHAFAACGVRTFL